MGGRAEASPIRTIPWGAEGPGEAGIYIYIYIWDHSIIDKEVGGGVSRQTRMRDRLAPLHSQSELQSINYSF